MKKPAIIYSYHYSRFTPFLRELGSKYPGTILVDFEPQAFGLALDKFRDFRQVVSADTLRAESSRLVAERLPAVLTALREKYPQLPKHELFGDEEVKELNQAASTSLNDIFRYYLLFENLRESYDLQAVVCSLAPINSSQALIECAKAHSIPTVHLEHGSYPQPEPRYPEPADVVCLGDDFCAEILLQTRESPMRIAVTGLPFNTNPARLDDAARQRARHELGLLESDKVVLYFSSWLESLYIAQTMFAHESVQSLKLVISELMQLKLQGKGVKLLLRQHPTMKEKEDEDAFLFIAAELGFNDLILANGSREQALAACDVAIVESKRSTVILDAFSAARAVIALDLMPTFSHEIADMLIGDRLILADSPTALAKQLSAVLGDKSFQSETEDKVFNFIRGARRYSEQEAVKNMCELILGLAQNGNSFLQQSHSFRVL